MVVEGLAVSYESFNFIVLEYVAELDGSTDPQEKGISPAEYSSPPDIRINNY